MSSPSKKELQRLFSGPCDFLISAVKQADLPNSDQVEVAFAGRSNVGKSSLLNTLTNRKTLAKTSGTPGRTRQLNFFLLNQQLMLVDLPGYGYAKASKADIKKWTQLTLDYLLGRANLRRVFLLIDSRHGIKPNDKEIMGLFDEAAVSYQIVLTKADKVKQAELEKVIEKTAKFCQEHAALHPDILVTSSAKKTGIDTLQEAIASLL